MPDFFGTWPESAEGGLTNAEKWITMPINQGGHAETTGKEKISDEEAERRDDDVYGDVHVQHVHDLSRSNWSTDFP